MFGNSKQTAWGEGSRSPPRPCEYSNTQLSAPENAACLPACLPVSRYRERCRRGRTVTCVWCCRLWVVYTLYVFPCLFLWTAWSTSVESLCFYSASRLTVAEEIQQIMQDTEKTAGIRMTVEPLVSQIGLEARANCSPCAMKWISSRDLVEDESIALHTEQSSPTCLLL